MKRLANFPKGVALLPYLKEGDVLTYIMKDAEEERKSLVGKRRSRFSRSEKCENMTCMPTCPSKTRMIGRMIGFDIQNGDVCHWCIETLHYYLIRVKKGDNDA